MAAAGKRPELARHTDLHRTIPSCTLRVAVDATVSYVDLTSVTPTEGFVAASPHPPPHDLRGKRVVFTARGGAVTMLRADGTAGSVAPVAGHGLVLADGESSERLFIDPDGLGRLALISTGACNLDISYDVEIGL